MRSMQSWLDGYSADHRNPVNQVIHWICVPPIVWTVVALLWTVPVPPAFLKPGAWAVFAMVLAFAWYWKHSHRLGAALAVAFVALALLTAWLFGLLGPVRLRWLAVVVFVLAWIGQFIGHKFEGHRPSFLTDLSYLLVGPAWLMEKLLRRLGFKAHD
ncbi:MAG TPA: Mpo1-like protein [Frateuria sp.]|uniref:Mpo1 family 2-hydroxy fatty acid dioxygenase n=1 Tax=Frateuria sp. TaxID=2211372 RepID=UPI002D7F0DA4|nr:Mpo1-like protein [Frateuria sp.]HET6805942.1 Mpo1-like protein [Frateuria sp.]